MIVLSRRYFSLKSDGSLAYYKSAHDTDFGCRGAISIQVGQKTINALDLKSTKNNTPCRRPT